MKGLRVFKEFNEPNSEIREVQLELATALAQRVFLDHRIKDLLLRREKLWAKAKKLRHADA